MNNSQLKLERNALEDETVIDRKPLLREREGDLVRIIEALRKVGETQEWSSLKNHVFDGVVEKLEKDLLDEARKDDPDKLLMARLNGQLVWAKKYADLQGLADVFRHELTNVRRFLYGKTEE